MCAVLYLLKPFPVAPGTLPTVDLHDEALRIAPGFSYPSHPTQEMTNYKYNIYSFVGNSRSQKILKAKFATWEKALNTRKFSDISHYSIEVAHDFGGARTHNQAHFLHFGNQTQFVSVKKIACQKKGKNHNMKFTGKSDGYGNHSSMSNTRVAGELLEVPYMSIFILTKSIRP